MKRFAERRRLPTRHTSTPKGRFVLRADSIRPYNCGGKATDGATNSWSTGCSAEPERWPGKSEQ